MTQTLFFGQFLVDEGEIDEADLQRACAALSARNLLIGELAVRAGYLTRESAERINATQRRRNLPFGELARELDLLTQPQVDELLYRQSELHVFLGEALVAQGALSKQNLEHALDRFKALESETGDPFGLLPFAIMEEPFFEGVLDLVVPLARRVCKLRLKLSPPREWRGHTQLPVRTGVEIDVGRALRIGIALDAALAERLTTGMLDLPASSLDEDLPRHAAAEFLSLLARNAKAGLREYDQFDWIGTPAGGHFPQHGYAFELVEFDNRGVLVLSSD